jgi:hypothetical protein
MTIEHSTEELKRQWDAAEGRSRQAQNAAYEAKKRYKDRALEDALKAYADRGIVPGCKVIAVGNPWGAKVETRTPATFLAVKWDYDAVRTVLGARKADGSASKSMRHINFNRLELDE